MLVASSIRPHLVFTFYQFLATTISLLSLFCLSQQAPVKDQPNGDPHCQVFSFTRPPVHVNFAGRYDLTWAIWNRARISDTNFIALGLPRLMFSARVVLPTVHPDMQLQDVVADREVYLDVENHYSQRYSFVLERFSPATNIFTGTPESITELHIPPRLTTDFGEEVVGRLAVCLHLREATIGRWIVQIRRRD